MFSTILELIKTGFSIFQNSKNTNATTNTTTPAPSQSQTQPTQPAVDEVNQVNEDTERFNQVNSTNREEIKAGFSWRSFLGYSVTIILLYEYIIVPLLWHFFGFVGIGIPVSDIIRIIIILISGSF